MHPNDLEILTDVTRSIRAFAHQVICDAYAKRMTARGIRREKVRVILESAASRILDNLAPVTVETMETAFGDLIERPPTDAALYVEICDRLRGEAWSTWSQAIEAQMHKRGMGRIARDISTGAERDAKARYAEDDAATIREHYPDEANKERTA